MENKHFLAFSKATNEDWQASVNRELKNNTFENAISMGNSFGVEMDAFYTETSIPKSRIQEIQIAQKKEIDWKNTAQLNLNVNDNLLENVLFLKNIGYNTLKIRVENNFNENDLIELVFFLNTNKFPFLIVSNYATSLKKAIEVIESVYFKGIVVGYEGKADDIEPLISQLNTLSSLLEIANLNKIDLIALESNISTDYLFTIAKLRAIRYVFGKLLLYYNLTNKIAISAKTDIAFYEKENVHINIVRATSMGLSAVCGGCDHLEIVTFDNSIAEFSSRIAKNISELIKEESYFNKLTDPLAGSYFIENLTYKLVQKIWDEFTKQTI